MNNNLALVIIASSRKNGDTAHFVNEIFNSFEISKLDLLDYNIYGYNYNNNYASDDDFENLVSQMLDHDTIVFATPVYWYAMSGILKQVFDRFTDLVTKNKLTGRNLSGKSVYLIAVGSDPEIPPGFEYPFSLTAGYLNMEYKGSIYFSSKNKVISDEKKPEIKRFLDLIKKQT